MSDSGQLPEQSGPAGFGLGIGFYQYEGFPLEQKISWMAQGPGASVLAEAQAAVVDLGNDLIESEQTLRDLVNRLGGEWTGSAGGAAGRSMVTAASWSAGSAPVTGEAGSQVGLQGESVERTRYGMPGAAPRPEYGFGDAFGDAVNLTTGNLFDVQTDFDEQVAARRAADDEANRLLYAHEQATRTNLAAIAPLARIEPITVRADVPPTTPLVARETTENRITEIPRVHPNERTTNRTPDRTPDRNEREPEQKPDQKPEDQPRNQQDDRPEQREPLDQRQTRPEQAPETDQRVPSPPEPTTTPNHSGVTPSSFVPEADRPYPGPANPRGGFGPTGVGGGGVGGVGVGGVPGGFVGGAGGFVPGAEPVAGRAPGAAAGAVPPGGSRTAPTGARAAGVPGRTGGPGSLMGPAAGGARGTGDDDAEHTDRYFSDTDELFTTDDILVLNHSVIGDERRA